MFIISIPFMDLDQIYDSGQVFRWIKFRDGKYAIPYGDTCLEIEQQKERFIMNCPDEEFYNKWFDYFDLQTDYSYANFMIRTMCEEMKSLAIKASGIRILKQDIFETIVTFILVNEFGPEEAKELIGILAKKCGKRHIKSTRGCGKLKWYEFPTHQQILDKNLSDKFNNVKEFCRAIEKGELDIDSLDYLRPYEVEERLTICKGITKKCIKYICMYSLGFRYFFPLNKRISDVIEKEFDMTYDEFADIFYEYASYQSLIRLYLFYNGLGK